MHRPGYTSHRKPDLYCQDVFAHQVALKPFAHPQLYLDCPEKWSASVGCSAFGFVWIAFRSSYSSGSVAFTSLSSYLFSIISAASGELIQHQA
jgi:hypothetical protein